MEQWYLDNLVCPVDKTPLEYKDGKLISPSDVLGYSIIGKR